MLTHPGRRTPESPTQKIKLNPFFVRDLEEKKTKFKRTKEAPKKNSIRAESLIFEVL